MRLEVRRSRLRASAKVDFFYFLKKFFFLRYRPITEQEKKLIKCGSVATFQRFARFVGYQSHENRIAQDDDDDDGNKRERESN